MCRGAGPRPDRGLAAGPGVGGAGGLLSWRVAPRAATEPATRHRAAGRDRTDGASAGDGSRHRAGRRPRRRPVHYYRHRRGRGGSRRGGGRDGGREAGRRAERPAPVRRPRRAAGAATRRRRQTSPPTASRVQADKPTARKSLRRRSRLHPRSRAGAAPRTVKELRSALARLQNRVGRCHQRFQVDGVADVRVAVNPSGTVESASLAGEFEGTPTGDCIVRAVSAASFPTFDGTESVRVSHSFPLQ